MMGSGAMLGAGLVGLAEVSVMEGKMRQSQQEVATAGVLSYKDQEERHNQYVFRAKSQVHGLRAALHARRQTEDELIAALKAENANHPLASKEAVEAAVYDKEVAALVNPEVIKRTYPDGKLPEGAVVPPDGTYSIA